MQSTSREEFNRPGEPFGRTGNGGMQDTARQVGEQASGLQQDFFRVTDQVPSPVWYWSAVGSIVASAVFKMMGRDTTANFIGAWPPTFLLFGLYHKLIRPGR